MGLQYRSYDLGRQQRGSVAVVELRGNAANVRLMDAHNFNNFKNGRQHRYVGGLAKRSPVRLAIPGNGHWYVTVDLIGLRGSVRSSVVVEPRRSRCCDRPRAPRSAISVTRPHLTWISMTGSRYGMSSSPMPARTRLR
jgi:hypothetical protein